ncbi:MAG: hypothetical protein IPM45_10025 [Acidimicrobiales bacterium]|nr:hypothetical protein [Acidimicrobiales bacterium]
MTWASGGSVRGGHSGHDTVAHLPPAPPTPLRRPRQVSPPLPEGPDALPPVDEEQEALATAARAVRHWPSASSWFG